MLHHPRMLESLGNDISEHERGFERARNSDKEVRSSAQDCLLLRPLVPTLRNLRGFPTTKTGGSPA